MSAMPGESISSVQRESLHNAVRAAQQAVPVPGVGSSRLRTSGDINDTAVAFNVFSRLLATEGLRAALYALLRRTDYRFIAIFRFQDGLATSVVYVDRQDLSATQAAEVPDTATYCCFARDRDTAFVTSDASADSRTQGHPARDVVRAYCGIPIFQPEGGLIGTLCHYDLEPRDPDQLDLELLLQAASAIEQSGLVPPYPVRQG